MSSTSLLTPPLPAAAVHHRHSAELTLDGSTVNRRRTLARGGDLRVLGAHIKAKSMKLKMGYPKRSYSSYMPSSFACTSHSFTPSLEERENSASSSSNHSTVPDMAKKSSKLLTLPTLLTLARVAAVPIFIATYYANNWWGTTATTSIFVAAAITDWLDGYLARKMDLGSAFGAFLDPVADKLMVAATLILLCSRPPQTAFLGRLQWLFPIPAIAIIGREITMSAVREWAASQNTELLQAVAVNNLGKWKTAAQMVALTILLSTRDSSFAAPGALVISGVILLYISAGLAVWSLAVYMRKIWNVLLR